VSAVAFVAGATGFVGRELVATLRTRGVTTHAHVRPDSRDLARWAERFGGLGASLDTTPWDQVAMGARLTALGVSHLFCAIGTTASRAKAAGVTGDPYQLIDRRLTELLVGAAVASTRPRFVLLSSIGANPTSRTAYLRARGQADDAVIGSGLSYRIARPSFISGPGRDDRRVGERVGAVVAGGALALVGALGGRTTRDRYRAITPDVLAAALVRLAFDDGGDRIVTAEQLR
jgi:uncharacterized protein YbjT (DUF2867 family)